MDLSNLTPILAAAQTAPAGNPQANPQAEIMRSVLMLVMLLAVMYLVLLRPQQKRQRQHAEMLKTIKSGDKILTSGGIIGVVVTVKEKSISIRSADSKMEISKSAVAEIFERSGESSES